MLRTLAFGAALLLVGLAALVALVWWRQERIVFQPPGPPHPHAEGVERVRYAASDGQPLFGYLVRAADAAQPPARVLIAFHGNADLAAWLVPWGEEVARRTGWDVFLPEYRGYGGLDGSPTYAGSALDARAAYAVVRDSLGVPADGVALFGHSLGSAVAAELASATHPRVLVLQSPFTSARAMARRVVLRPVLWFWRLISRVHYDTEAQLRGLRTPVWVAHGERDFIIPLEMGAAVHAAAPVRGELLVVRGAGHNDVTAVAGEAYWRWLARALGTGAGAPAAATAPSAAP